MKSIVTEYDKLCAMCGKPAECTHHLLTGADRKKADADRLTLPICNACHNMGDGTSKIHGNIAAEVLSKFVGELAWEKEFYKEKCGIREDEARTAFRHRYGKSYL